MSDQATTVEELLREYQQLPEFCGMVLKSVNERGGFDSTPLHIAIYRERPHEVKILLNAGADPNAAGEYGERPLHVALNCWNPNIIEQLLRAGALPELKDKEGLDVWKVADILRVTREFAEIIDRFKRAT